MPLSTLHQALEQLRAGRPVLVADAQDRENEGDAIMAAQFATPDWIAWMVRHTSGYLCAPMPAEVADRLELPLMVTNNQDSHGTAYTVSVDATDRASTGISAVDRAHTVNVLADPRSTAAGLIRPGHVLPLRAREGGVLTRGGHTEAAVDLMTLAGLSPVGVIAEMVNDDGTMMRLPDLEAIGARENLAVISTAQIISWLTEHPIEKATTQRDRVKFEVETTLPTAYGTLITRGYTDLRTGATHVALTSPKKPDGAPLIRVHSECLTGEAFGSERCECGPQLHAALRMISEHGGTVVYLRGHEGRGIGLLEKLHAYNLQDEGLDTLDANLALGHAADEREYGGAAAIIQDLGFTHIRLLSNNPAKATGLELNGVAVDELVPLIVGASDLNIHYLETKRDRMGHRFPQNISPVEPITFSKGQQA